MKVFRRLVELYLVALINTTLTVVSFVLTMHGRILIDYFTVPVIPTVTVIYVIVINCLMFIYLAGLFWNIRLFPTMLILSILGFLLTGMMNFISPHLSILCALVFWLILPLVARILITRKFPKMILSSNNRFNK